MQMKVPSPSDASPSPNPPAPRAGGDGKRELPSLNLDDPIPLTPLEERLFSVLLAAARKSTRPVTLRVAGGWVRDKILFPGRDLGTDVDIDIALDTMHGAEFGELLNTHLQSQGYKAAGVGVIQKNPDQSKHLETATMRVLGVWLDLVNLRTETYSHDSRIPDISIGTPEEDALRRDLTINALFYNIGARRLEDYTGCGFDDIRARVIRTPLPPLTTLLDDPLRALRAVRFAARLNFVIHADLATACKRPEVHAALAAKISRERVSAELHRMLGDNAQNAPRAIALLVEFGLFPVVLRMPPSDTLVLGERETQAGLPPLPPPDLPRQALSALINLHSLDDRAANISTPRTQLIRYAALLLPIAALRCRHGKKSKEMTVATYVMRVELRLSASDASTVNALLDGSRELRALVHEGKAGDDPIGPGLDRLRVARAMRAAGGAAWKAALQLALVADLPVVSPTESFAAFLDDTGGRIDLGDEARIAITMYDQFRQRVDSLHMDGVWDLKPLINGNELREILPKMKKGPDMGRIMKEQVDFMVQNPAKGKEDLVEWVKQSNASFI